MRDPRGPTWAYDACIPTRKKDIWKGLVLSTSTKATEVRRQAIATSQVQAGHLLSVFVRRTMIFYLTNIFIALSLRFGTSLLSRDPLVSVNLQEVPHYRLLLYDDFGGEYLPSAK